jgi:hypothetical protein
MTSRWHSIQRVMFYRMREIEIDLGIYKERYLNYLDNASQKGKAPDSQQVNDMISSMKAKHKSGGARRAVQYVSWILLVAWFLFLVLQIAALQNWV